MRKVILAMVYNIIFKIVYDKIQWNSARIPKIIELILWLIQCHAVVMRDIYKLRLDIIVIIIFI
jgi:hypothetical protein